MLQKNGQSRLNMPVTSSLGHCGLACRPRVRPRPEMSVYWRDLVHGTLVSFPDVLESFRAQSEGSNLEAEKVKGEVLDPMWKREKMKRGNSRAMSTFQ